MRRDKVARANHAAPSRAAQHFAQARHFPLRAVATAVGAMLAIAVCEREIVEVAARWLGLKGLVGEQGLSIFTFVSVTFSVAALYGAAPALVAGAIASTVLWVVFAFNPCTLACTMSGILLVAVRTRRVRRMGNIAFLAIDAALLQLVLGVVIMACCNKFAPMVETIEAWQVAAVAVFNAVSIPLAFLVALPLAERLSGRTADCSLAPFANLEHPLLQRLSREAPGTYGHSMVVADLSSSAAEAIGANPLLARLGGYYHDIGKLSNPRFFMENQTLLGNPHDSLPPSISAMIVASHVKDGAILAREHGLPRPIVGIIASHHGTTAMEWFRRKAENIARENGGGATSDEWPYRYAGPTPESREETIVSIADSVEAASRSLASPTGPDLSRLVNGIVAAKLADGQFARSALTLQELEEVKRSLVLTLVHRLHVRAAYPEDERRGR